MPTARHTVLHTPLAPPYPPGHDVIRFGMGCFWGAEPRFWTIPGVYTTSAGYAGGYTPNPTYMETFSGQTGHLETVQVVFDPATVTLEELLAVFWEGHDPTQKNRQGGDVGTQYRSAVLVTDAAQRAVVETSRTAYAAALAAAGHPAIQTEILDPGAFYFAEPMHQQYRAVTPDGTCGLGGTGVTCTLGSCRNDGKPGAGK